MYQKLIGVNLINYFVDGYRSVSAWEGEESKKNGIDKDKIHVITNGLEEEAYLDVDMKASEKIKDYVEKSSPYLLQLGRIHPIKNQATSIRALTLLPKNIKLILAGPVTDFDYKRQLDVLIKKTKLGKRVIFAGTVEGVDKYYLLKHCLVYTHMALWESYCNTVHESMSQGCVCIVSKDTALEELIIDKKSGYSVVVFDYKSVAEVVKFILDKKNKKTIDKIKKSAFDYTKNHSWKEIAKQVGEMYNKYL